MNLLIGESSSPEPNLLGCYQNLTDLREGNTQLQLTLAFHVGKENIQIQCTQAILSNLSERETFVKFTVQSHRFTKRLRPNHRTVSEGFPFLTAHRRITKCLLVAVLFTWYHMSSYQKKITWN